MFNQIQVSSSDLGANGFLAVLKVTDQNVEEVQGGLLALPWSALCCKEALGERIETFEGSGMQPLSKLDEKVSAGNSWSVVG